MIAIPAHPLALTSRRVLDERRQEALTRYYCEAGVGGIAVGVHTTQFAIRDPDVGLFEPVLRLAVETIREFEQRSDKRILRIAGICGPTAQATAEAAFARGVGYELGLVSLAALPHATDDQLLQHCKAIAEEIPLCGFYLQPAVGGRPLSYEFWRRCCDEIEELRAIKVAPFDRYQTLNVLRAVADSGRAKDIALYTGNDDNIIPDLITEFCFASGSVRFSGGLLGQWAVWTRSAVELAESLKTREAADLLAEGAALTDANAALFDVRNAFHGCIAGLHEILRRQGLLAGRWCLDPKEDLSPGQIEEIDRVCKEYPHLMDDEFVASNRDRWLRL